MTLRERIRYLALVVPLALRVMWQAMRQPPEHVYARNETMWDALIGELQGIRYHVLLLEKHIAPNDEWLDVAQESIGHAINALEACGEANIAAA